MGNVDSQVKSVNVIRTVQFSTKKTPLSPENIVNESGPSGITLVL